MEGEAVTQRGLRQIGPRPQSRLREFNMPLLKFWLTIIGFLAAFALLVALVSWVKTFVDKAD